MKLRKLERHSCSNFALYRFTPRNRKEYNKEGHTYHCSFCNLWYGVWGSLNFKGDYI